MQPFIHPCHSRQLVLLHFSQDPKCLNSRRQPSSAYTNYHNSCHSRWEDLLENAHSYEKSFFMLPKNRNQCSRYQMLEPILIDQYSVSFSKMHLQNMLCKVKRETTKNNGRIMGKQHKLTSK